MKKPKAPTRGTSWTNSAAFRLMARDAITAYNRTRHLLPKCGARRRTDGEPCRHLAMANGRCHLHGGRTPKGDEWHRPRWPDGKAPNATDKMHRKLADHARKAKKRAVRLAELSPEAWERHQAWQRTHKPGKASERVARRHEAAQRAHLRSLFDKPELPSTLEDERLQSEIDELRARIAADRAPQRSIFD